MKNVKARLACLLIAALPGCVSLTRHQEKAYSRAVVANYHVLFEPKYDPYMVGMMSLFLPGTGHLALEEPGRAVFWLIVSAFSPGVPALAAYYDAKELNRMAIAEEQLKREDEISDSAKTKKDMSVRTCQCGRDISVEVVFCPWCGRRSR